MGSSGGGALEVFTEQNLEREGVRSLQKVKSGCREPTASGAGVTHQHDCGCCCALLSSPALADIGTSGNKDGVMS